MLLKSLFIILSITINLTGALPSNRNGPVSEKVVYQSSSAIVFGSQVLEKAFAGAVQVAASLPSKLQEGVQNARASSLHRDSFAQSAASSGSSIQQAQFDQNVNQQTTSARPNSYAEKQPSAGSQDASGDYLNHQSANPSYQTSTQRSQNSYSPQDNDRSKSDGRPSNNGYGSAGPYSNRNNDNTLPDSIPLPESETDSVYRDNLASNYQPTTSAPKWTQSSNTQRYETESTTRRSQGWPTPSPTSAPTTPSRRRGDENKRPSPQFVLDPNPILSPVDRVPIMIEYPKIDYDKVELTTRAPISKNPNRHKNRHSQGNDPNRSPDASS